jgi:hypothetical protein
MSLVSFQVWAQNQNANAAPSAEEEIKSLEQERNVAILNGDAAALDRMTADDYTFITLRGTAPAQRDESTSTGGHGADPPDHEGSPGR